MMSAPVTWLSLWHGVQHFRPTRYRGSREVLVSLARQIAADHGLTLEDLQSRKQSIRVAQARQAFMAAAYETCCYSYPEIGRVVNRDHTTVWHGINAHRERMAA